MSWLKKSSRRKNMYEKGQEEVVENTAAVEETCGKTAEEAAATVENIAEEPVVQVVMETLADNAEVPDEVVEIEIICDVKADEEPEEDEVSLECFVESQPEKEDKKAFVLTVITVVAAVAAVIGVVTVLFRKKK